MAQAKLTKAFDYYKPGGKMTAYPKGYEGDMPDAHYKAAVAAGAVVEASRSTGGSAGGTGGGTGGGANK